MRFWRFLSLGRVHVLWLALISEGLAEARFTAISAEESGIDFENIFAEEAVMSFANIMPGGVAAGDVDGDGLVDLYFC